MAIKSEASSVLDHWSVWALAACALAAVAVALVLAWQNAELKSELMALKSERPISVVPATQPASSAQPMQGQAVTTGTPAVTPQATENEPTSLLQALRASEQAAKEKRNGSSAAYPFGLTKQ